MACYAELFDLQEERAEQLPRWLGFKRSSAYNAYTSVLFAEVQPLAILPVRVGGTSRWNDFPGVAAVILGEPPQVFKKYSQAAWGSGVVPRQWQPTVR